VRTALFGAVRTALFERPVNIREVTMTRLFSQLIFASLLFAIPLRSLAQEADSAQAARKDIQATLGFVPGFLKAMPDIALPGAWEEMKTLQMNPNTALPGKTKELIGLAVAAQVPCKYCTFTHTEFAKLNGATQTEIGEAVVMSALTRHWSTVLQGVQTDVVKFRADIMKVVDRMKKMAASKTPPPKPLALTDANSALKDIEQSWGFVPDFMRKFPPEALVGAWKEERALDMGESALPGKTKSLIGLAVASQIPCRFCIIADTEFAKLEGATEAEISEAIAMAALTRHWSTYLNGMQTDDKAFQLDIEHVVKNVKSKPKPAPTQASNQPVHAAAARN
jgi:AhpD family alkylhydroperoxidase